MNFDKKLDPANPELKNVRIRYSADHKNTLVTIKEGDSVFWGMSRSNAPSGEVFKKSTGRFIAYGRALKARHQDKSVAEQKEFSFFLHESGLRGYCDSSTLNLLFDHFDNIAQFLEVE